MSEISALPSGIAKWLSEQEQLSNITFMTEYPAIKKAIPLRKAIVAIGLREVKIVDSFVDDGSGILVEQEFCRSANLSINLAIHVPFSYGGDACHDVFTDVMDCLTFATDLNIEESGCGNVTADRDTDAFVLEGFITIKADFCPAISSDLNFKSFENHELFCGSHITDESIHVTPEDKDKWTNPFIVGSYTGNGNSSRIIDLGFKPRFVVAFLGDSPPSVYDNATGVSNCYYAHATEDAGTIGAEITAKGFRVYNGESNEFMGGVPYLNVSGYTYGYMAIK